MSSPQIQQSVLYISTDDAETEVVTTSSNISGYGTSQSQQVIYIGGAGLPVGRALGWMIQSATPAPLLYFQLGAATDTFNIFTPDGEFVQPENGPTAGTYFFQPAPSVAYNFVFFSSVVRAAGDILVFYQAVVQNTIGQIVDLNSVVVSSLGGTVGSDGTMIKPTAKTNFSVRTLIDMNTPSAIPNTVALDLVEIPVKQGKNFIATINALLGANAIVKQGALNGTTYGVKGSPVILVATQGYSFEYDSTEDGYYTGTMSLVIATVGTTTIPPTIAIKNLSAVANTSQLTGMVYRPTISSSVLRSKPNAVDRSVDHQVMEAYMQKCFDRMKEYLGSAMIRLENKLDGMIKDLTEGIE
jgi:hypothetical protein